MTKKIFIFLKFNIGRDKMTERTRSNSAIQIFGAVALTGAVLLGYNRFSSFNESYAYEDTPHRYSNSTIPQVIHKPSTISCQELGNAALRLLRGGNVADLSLAAVFFKVNTARGCPSLARK